MVVKHLTYNEIDRTRWDATIATSTNSLPYAYSWYLDAVSPQWEALASNNYEFVMPLPVKRKFGVKYVIQPRWVQQLGVFSAQPITKEIVKSFSIRYQRLSS